MLLLLLGDEVDAKGVEEAVGEGRKDDVALSAEVDERVLHGLVEDAVVSRLAVLGQNGPQAVVNLGNVLYGLLGHVPGVIVLWRVQREEAVGLVGQAGGNVAAGGIVEVDEAVAHGVVGIDPIAGQFAEDAHDLAPDDELREALHEEDEGEVERVVQRGPGLLAQGGEVGVAHPVKVDEEYEVDCCSGGGDDADDVGVCDGAGAVLVRSIGVGLRRGVYALHASGRLTMVTTFCAMDTMPSPRIMTVSRLMRFIRCVRVKLRARQKLDMRMVRRASPAATQYQVMKMRLLWLVLV